MTPGTQNQPWQEWGSYPAGPQGREGAAKGRQEGFALEETCLAGTSAQQWRIKTPQGSIGYFWRPPNFTTVSCNKSGVLWRDGGFVTQTHLSTSTAFPSRTPVLSPANTELFGVIHTVWVPLGSHFPVKHPHIPRPSCWSWQLLPSSEGTGEGALSCTEHHQEPSEWKSSLAGFKVYLQLSSALKSLLLCS